MTVSELIAALQALDPSLPVVVSGYEAGYDDPQPPRVIRTKVRDDESKILGKYEDEDAWGEGDLTAVAIER